MTNEPEVTQDAREAAARWSKKNSRHHQSANTIRGSCDTAPLVQAFAAFEAKIRGDQIERDTGIRHIPAGIERIIHASMGRDFERKETLAPADDELRGAAEIIQEMIDTYSISGANLLQWLSAEDFASRPKPYKRLFWRARPSAFEWTEWASDVACRATFAALSEAKERVQRDSVSAQADAMRDALEPVMDWYQSDEQHPRCILTIVKEVVADLQADRTMALHCEALLRDADKLAFAAQTTGGGPDAGLIKAIDDYCKTSGPIRRDLANERTPLSLGTQTMDDATVERVERAIRDAQGCGLTIEGKPAFCDDKRAHEPNLCDCRSAARAAIAAMQGDMVLVPREPTEAMLEAVVIEPTHLYGQGNRGAEYQKGMKVAVQVERLAAALADQLGRKQ